MYKSYSVILKEMFFVIISFTSWVIFTNIVISLNYSNFIDHNILYKNITIIDRTMESIDYFYLLSNELHNGDKFIFFIYFVLLIIYFGIIFAHILQQKEIFKRITFFSLNAAPMLGLLGTIYSLSILVADSGSATTLISTFKDNFAPAVTTTLIGGIVYILTLLNESIVE